MGDPQLNLKQVTAVSDLDMNSSLSCKGRDLHHCQWCKCLQRHFCLHPSTAPCSCRCCWYEVSEHKLDLTGGQRPTALFRCGAPVTASRKRKCSATLLPNTHNSLLFSQSDHATVAMKDYMQIPVSIFYTWNILVLATFSPLALNHLPSTCPANRNKLHLGCSLHKTQTKSHPTAQCIHISRGRLCVLAL